MIHTKCGRTEFRGPPHWSPRSPYVRKVMIAIHEMGLQDRVCTVRTVVGGTTPHEGLMRINPLGKIPTLELPDGTAIHDSPVIIEYLDTLHDGPKLYPAAWPQRLTALRRHALGQGMLDTALPLLSESFRPPGQQSEPHKELWRARLTACVAALEEEAEALATSGFTVGHLAIGVALGYLDFRTMIDIFKSEMGLEHSRHRSVINAVVLSSPASSATPSDPASHRSL